MFGFDIYSNINQLDVLKAFGTFSLELRFTLGCLWSSFILNECATGNHWVGDYSRLYWVNDRELLDDICQSGVKYHCVCLSEVAIAVLDQDTS